MTAVDGFFCVIFLCARMRALMQHTKVRRPVRENNAEKKPNLQIDLFDKEEYEPSYVYTGSDWSLEGKTVSKGDQYQRLFCVPSEISLHCERD